MSYDRRLERRYGLWRTSSYEEIDLTDMVQPTGGRLLRHGRYIDMVQEKKTLDNFDMTVGRSRCASGMPTIRDRVRVDPAPLV